MLLSRSKESRNSNQDTTVIHRKLKFITKYQHMVLCMVIMPTLLSATVECHLRKARSRISPWSQIRATSLHTPITHLRCRATSLLAMGSLNMQVGLWQQIIRDMFNQPGRDNLCQVQAT